MIPTAPCQITRPTADLDALSRSVALLDPAAIDRLVAAQVAAAVRERRIDDAVLWQRVRMRAHRLRGGGATAACRA